MFTFFIIVLIIVVIWWFVTTKPASKLLRYDRIDNINEVNFLSRHYGKPVRIKEEKALHSDKACPFCTLPAERILHENEHAIAIRDAFPVSPGHTLIIPKRHVASFFEITPEEQKDLMDLLASAPLSQRAFPERSRREPDGYNIGINDGAAAGQTVPHLHIHLIPRYKGDVADPRGGVRWVIPEKAKYWND